MLRAWGDKDQCFWCGLFADEDRVKSGDHDSLFIGSGAGLRRMVLLVIALLLVLLSSLIGYGLWRAAPYFARFGQVPPKVASQPLPPENMGYPRLAGPPLSERPLPGRMRLLRPRTPPSSWVTDDDYPVEAQRAGEEGTVAFTLFVDAAGIPQRCEVDATSGSERLDVAACALLKRRGRFIPALNAAGHPVPAIFRSRFTWQLAR